MSNENDPEPELDSMTGCGHDDPKPPHVCPFQEEINEISTLCTCCQDCEDGCAMDI